MSTHYVIISDLHFGKDFYDYVLNTSFNAEMSLNDYWDLYTQKYVLSIIKKQIYLKNEKVVFVFLGDIIDRPTLKFPYLDLVLKLIEEILIFPKWEIIIQVGNHDTSSYKGDWHKTTLSLFCHYDKRVKIINSPYLVEYEEYAVLHLPYVRYVDLLPTLWSMKDKTSNKEIYLCSHNYIYVADAFINTPCVNIKDVHKILNCKKLQVFNGHLHTTHYETGYFQLGSVSPTSFKQDPFASGICYFQLGTNNFKLYKNTLLIFLSITNYHLQDKLRVWLDNCREHDTKVFLQYKAHLQLTINYICAQYSDIIIGLRCRDGHFKTS